MLSARLSTTEFIKAKELLSIGYRSRSRCRSRSRSSCDSVFSSRDTNSTNRSRHRSICTGFSRPKMSYTYKSGSHFWIRRNFHCRIPHFNKVTEAAVLGGLDLSRDKINPKAQGTVLTSKSQHNASVCHTHSAPCSDIPGAARLTEGEFHSTAPISHLNSNLLNNHQDPRESSTFATESEKKHPNYSSRKDEHQGKEASLLSLRHIDPAAVKQVYYFDTLAFTKKLEASGFTRQQAEGFAENILEIINTTLDHQGRHMVTKPQQEIVVQQLMSEIVSVKKDMTLLQKSEFSSLKTETEKQSNALSQVQAHMNDEILKLKGQFSLDINLERGRAIEAHAESEKKLQVLHNKIDTEVANLRTTFEVYRNDVLKYAGGTVIAVASLMLGFMRMWH